MPVNMPTHAHGQGYADLNFLIPELVAAIDYKKGPYYRGRSATSRRPARADIRLRRSLADGIRRRCSWGSSATHAALLADSPRGRPRAAALRARVRPRQRPVARCPRTASKLQRRCCATRWDRRAERLSRHRAWPTQPLELDRPGAAARASTRPVALRRARPHRRRRRPARSAVGRLARRDGRSRPRGDRLRGSTTGSTCSRTSPTSWTTR